MKNIDETKNYIVEEIEQNELTSKKHKKVSGTLNHIEHFLIFASTVTGCISISDFASLVGTSIGIMSSAKESKICLIAGAIKKCKSIIEKKKKKRYKTALLAKTKLNSIEELTCKALIDSNIIHDGFF